MTQIVQVSLLFDYSQLDADTREVIQQHTSEIKKMVRRSLDDAVSIGQRLVDTKDRIGHGYFGKWLNAEFEWTWKQATRFMDVYLKFDKLSNLDIAPSAAYLLAAPSTPEAAFAEATERAMAGETISRKTARSIVRKHKQDEDGYEQKAEELAEDGDAYDWDVQAGKAISNLKTFFRYPGGKSKIAGALVTEIVSLAKGGDEYREPFVGGGGVFVPVLATGKFRRMWINDYDYGIYSIWLSVKSFHKELIDRVCQFMPSVEAFYEFKETLNQDCRHFHPSEVALMKIAIHQMSYSGLGTRAGGPIGGAGQKSQYDVSCRWSPNNIVEQVCAIHDAMKRVDMVITNMDYRALMHGDNAVMYLDPPYYEQGGNLYHVTFTEQDHKQLAERLQGVKFPWLLSYDKCDDVRGLYAWANMRETEEIHYSISLKNGSAGKQSRFSSEYLIAGGGL